MRTDGLFRYRRGKRLKLKTELMLHQMDAVSKMIRSRIGGLFAEMGTGKTRTAIELVQRRQARISNVVWFCPVSLKETINYEIRKHTDCESIYIFDDKTNERNIPCALWYIIGIESMSSSARVILTVDKLIDSRSFVIVDESSYIKGHRASRTKWITDLSKRALYRLILTGTPISQGVVDLYAQMRFLSPKILGYHSFYSFAANHLEYSEKFPDMIVRSHNTDYLAAKIKPYVYQVTKDECLDLPTKIYKRRYFEMTSWQQELYAAIKNEFLETISDEDFSSIDIFKLFTELQQIVCGFVRHKGKMDELPHYRIDRLMDIVASIPDHEKIIIWAKYIYDIDGIRGALAEKFGDKSISIFHGGLNEKERNQQIDLFRKQARFFIATPSSGGHGLTLNEAHYVIFYNNSFKYAERLQAEDRCHRIGQENRVTYIDIICSDSIDERIDNALTNKGNVVDAFKNEVDRVKSFNKLKDMVKKI